MNEFNHKGFDWKRAIWDIGQRLAKVEERVSNELAHMAKFTRWFMIITGGIIVGLTIAILKGIF